MNICVITPLYPVCGRSDIKTDTQAIHLLLKYLKKENKIHVFNISRVSPREFAKSILNSKDSLKNAYNYQIDDINATLLRYRAYPKQKLLTKRQIVLVRQKIIQTLAEKKFVPDVIVVHIPSSFSIMLDGIFNGVKKIAVLHRTDVNIVATLPKLAKIINREYDLISCRSNSVKRMAQNLGIEVDEKIVFSGIPKEYLDPTYVHYFNNLKKQLNLLYVGKLIKRKHPEYLIRLCCDLNEKGINTHVHIIGDGPLRDKLQAIVNRCSQKEKIKMTRFVEREQVQKYMRGADIFILPSVNETLGLVYLEAMAAGCITIGVINEGIDGIIRNGINGYLINPENYDSLFDCVNSIIEEDSETIQQVSNNAIKMANCIPEEVASKNYLMLMQC